MSQTSTEVPLHRSWSQVNALRNCGWMFKLERIDKVMQRPSVPAVAGKVIHAATETVDHLIHNGVGDACLLREGANATFVTSALEELRLIDSHYADPATWKKYGRATQEKPNAEDWQWFLDFGIPNAINAYINWRLATKLNLLDIPGFGPAIEVPFDLYLDGLHIRGYIDRVWEGPYLFDIKSGQKPKTDEQLGIYRKALLDGAGIKVQYGGYIYGLKTGQYKTTEPISLTHWTDDKLRQVYVEASRLIDAGIYVPAPGEQCFRCSVSHACEFAQSAI